MARYSEAHSKATQRYIKKAYDEVKIRVPKGKKEEYKAKAKKKGYDSLTRYIIDCIEKG